ncbi:MAG TPA: SRPBCC family protein [Steroidobacteraceae bacterium]|jgi:uncharacterized protein YndB with AHSA1/START domain|nr:SRPBCC family protein [Steroidobacteraceae bacterium]
MNTRQDYRPGPAAGGEVRQQGDTWTLVLARELRHPPERVWEALTDPAQLHEWAPFDADGSLAAQGATVKLTTIGAPKPVVSETTISRAERPRLLEYRWGNQEIRWQLEPLAQGTRLTLWHSIDRRYTSMGAAGWHICLDVLDRLLGGEPLGRIVAGDAMQFNWPRLNAEYASQFGIEAPAWPPNARKN